MKLKRSYILALFLSLALAMVFIVPVYEEPDEPQHLDYVNFVATRHQLPNQYVEGQQSLGEGHQAPLYYVLAATFTGLILNDNRIDIAHIPNKKFVANGGSESAVPLFKHLDARIFAHISDRVAFYELRMFSVLCALGTLLTAYAIAKPFFNEEKWRLAVVFCVATLPQFIFNSVAVSNDSLTTLLSSLVVLASLNLLRNPTSVRLAIKLGFLLGLAILSKKTALFLAGVVAIEFLYLMAKKAAFPRVLLIRNGLLCSALALVVASPYFIHNYLNYGELLGNRMELATVAGPILSRSLLSTYFITPFIPVTAGSFIGMFGWMTFAFPIRLIAFYCLLIAIAIVGLVMQVFRRSFRNRAAAGLFLLYITGALASLVAINLHLNQPQGRTLFPAIVPIAVLLTLGARYLVERLRSEQWQRWLLLAIGSFFILGDGYMIFLVYSFYANLSYYT